jgi:glutamate-5-semialdehyde dehydrogenase
VNDLERRLRETRAAGRVLGTYSPAEKVALLEEIAATLERSEEEIVAENQADLAGARERNVDAALLDRLALDPDRIADMAAGVRAVGALPDPVGRIDGGGRLTNGLEIERTRVPLGVVGVVYEGRPNVTTDAAALCLKSGNAAVLRGSRVAARSNAVLGKVLVEALEAAGAPAEAVTMLGTDRDELKQMISAKGLVDLVIPRGGEELKAFLEEHARVPVIFAAAGNNHVYVDASADLDAARKIAVNSKVQRPGVCNAAETLLVHRAVAPDVLADLVRDLQANGVELRVSAEARAALNGDGDGLAAAGSDDFATEFLALVMAVHVVDSLEDAIAHINEYGSGHSEAIVTRDLQAARTFRQLVDAAAVYVNASTRFTDGGVFGMGAEIGISTQKLHARGPIGLNELTTTKYLVTGDGHVR